jgi:hypothetical protein
MSARKHQADETFDGFSFTGQLKDLYEALFREGGKDFVERAILRLSQEASLTITDLQKLDNEATSFSTAKWEAVAPSLSLRTDLGLVQLDPLTVPNVFLPPSFHREMMKNALRWMDVYQEPDNQMREEARARLLEAVRMSNFWSSVANAVRSGMFQSARCSKVAWSTSLKVQHPIHQKYWGGKLNTKFSCLTILSYS